MIIIKIIIIIIYHYKSSISDTATVKVMTLMTKYLIEKINKITLLLALLLSLHAACFSLYLKQLGGWGWWPPPLRISTSTHGMKLKLTPEIAHDKVD